MILPYQNIYPKIHSSVLIAEGAYIVGDVEIGKDSGTWFNTITFNKGEGFQNFDAIDK